MVKTLAILTYLFGGMHTHHSHMSLNSSVLQPNQEIPKVYTCYGHNISPPLHWHHLPADTRSLVIIMFDKDAPEKHRYLWARYNILLQDNWIASNAPLLRGEQDAENSWGHLGYDGPCPSYGKHHYVIKLYALKVRFYFHKKVTVPELLIEMKHRVIATATLKVQYSVHVPTKTNRH